MRNRFLCTYLAHHQRILFAARVFVILMLVALVYVSYQVMRGRDDPRERARLAARIATFQAPEGYELQAAFYSAFARAAVWNEPGTGRYIRLIHKRTGEERFPEGFREMFWKADGPIDHYPRHGGFHDLVITATGTLEHAGLETLVARGTFTRKGAAMEGALGLTICPADGRSLLVVAEGPAENYQHEDFEAFIESLGCEPGRPPH